MNDSRLGAGWILGCGGLRPGIRLVTVEPDTGTSEKTISMPGSVYAIHVDPVHGQAAVATRAGTIHLFQLESVAENGLPQEIARLLHGRPVLSVCLTGEGSLVSADDSGQVVCWRPQQEFAPERWLTQGPTICSLNADAEPFVVGLGGGGQLIFWDLRTGKPVTQLVGLPPVAPLALVRLANWTLGGHTMTVYPAQDGQLVVVHGHSPVVRVHRAHEGRFYAAFQIDDRLVTIGHDDGVARLWRWSNDEPVCDGELPAFPGVIGATWNAQADPPSGMAVLGAGNAVIFTVTCEGLRVVGTIPGDGHRVVATASEHSRHQAASREAERRGAELQRRIVASLDSGDADHIDDDLLELEQLGYRSASLSLRAQRAARVGDELAELAALHQLAAQWSGDRQMIPESLLGRYIDLLLQYQQLELAFSVLNRIEPIYPGLADVLELRESRRAVEMLQAGRTVVHVFSGGSEQVGKTMRAIGILGLSLKGLWELHRSPAVLLPDIELSPERLAGALCVSGKNGPQQDIDVVAQPVLWVDGRICEEDISVFLLALDGRLVQSIKIALRVALCPAGSAVTRSVLLDLSTRERGWGETELIGLATQLQDGANRAEILAPVNDWILTTLRKLRGAALASVSSTPGGGI